MPEREPEAVQDIACDVPYEDKATECQTNQEEAEESDFAKILRVKKEVMKTKPRQHIAGNDKYQQYPRYQHKDIPPQVQQCQLERK